RSTARGKHRSGTDSRPTQTLARRSSWFSEAVPHPCRRVLDILARSCLVDEPSGDEVRVVRDDRKVTIDPPFCLDGDLLADARRATAASRPQERASGRVDAVAIRLAPECVGVEADGERLQRMQFEVGMDVEEV